ncbi:MAG: hypothetical protein ACM3MI_10285 [Clostridiales bacterium]
MSKTETAKEKVCILFVEGKTEHQFYSALITYLKTKFAKKKCKEYKVYDVKGIGKFESKVPAKFRNEVKVKFGDAEYHIFLCYDHDVFKFNPKPPVNWKKIEAQLREDGAAEVYNIVAKDSMEDWLLVDIDGIVKNLKIKKPKKIIGKNGNEKVQYLFSKANKIYVKGDNTNNLISSLSIRIIYEKIKGVFKELESFLFDRK